MAIEVRPLTMAVRMRASGMQRTALLSWYKEAAIEYEVSEEDVFRFLNDFCIMSARIVANGKSKLPFELGEAVDSADELKRKFDLYLGANVSEVDKIERMLEAEDAPNDPDLAPDAEPTDPEA